MTEIDIQKALIDRFNTINDLGVEYINPTNVLYPNKKFKEPEEKRWFELSFLSNAPVVAGICEEAQNRFTGIFQIDICTPLDSGEDEVNSKYKTIVKLFNRDIYFSDVVILRTYRARQTVQKDHYRTTVRVEWESDIDKE